MTVLRIKTIKGLIDHWDFIVIGLKHVQKFLRYNADLEMYRKILFHLVRQENAWIGIVFNEAGEPVGFGVAHEVTPLFAQRPEYEVSILYHRPKEADATSALQDHFERFCIARNVTTYYVTTRRDSGSALRCLQGPRYGLKREHTVFRKDLTYGNAS